MQAVARCTANREDAKGPYQIVPPASQSLSGLERVNGDLDSGTAAYTVVVKVRDRGC
jgi:hypothetical protein